MFLAYSYHLHDPRPIWEFCFKWMILYNGMYSLKYEQKFSGSKALGLKYWVASVIEISIKCFVQRFGYGYNTKFHCRSY